jgi:hemoglobin
MNDSTIHLLPGNQPAPERIDTIYDLLGGMQLFERLAARFYWRVGEDPLLRPMFPPDLTLPAQHLALFLAQRFGGPQTYSLQRGHPRLRMRHMPFRIGPAERDAWIGHMLAAMDELAIPEPARTAMARYFEDSATFLINAAER